MEYSRHPATTLLTLTLLFLTSAANGPVHAQLDSALSLFSICTGNLWQYKHVHITSSWPPGPADFYEERVLSDSLCPNGKKYKFFQLYPHPGADSRLLRIDSATGCVYAYLWGGEELPLDSLRASPNDNFHGLRCTGVAIDTVLGIVTTTKSFEWAITGYGRRYQYAMGLGIVYKMEWDIFGDYELGSTDISELIYAKVDGREYGTPLTVEKPPENLPSDFVLEQNYPNPFNSTTTVNVFVPQTQSISLEVFSSIGQVVARLHEGEASVGWHAIHWGAHGCASGVYICRLRTASGTVSRKLLFLQ
jgi:hypothetical protein